MAPVKLITAPANPGAVDGDFGNLNLDVGTAVLLMVASTNGQVRKKNERHSKKTKLYFQNASAAIRNLSSLSPRKLIPSDAHVSSLPQPHPTF